jgi:hypothetical protein
MCTAVMMAGGLARPWLTGAKAIEKFGQLVLLAPSRAPRRVISGARWH